MEKKVVTLLKLISLVETFKQKGDIIVTTNGTFDIIHLGHLKFLEQAKSIGNILIVLINSDTSTKKFKGDKRPIFSEQERAMHLASLSSVDYVSIFPEDKPLSFLQAIKPHIHTKGGSFIPERIKEEKELVESWGGKMVTFEMEKDYSTTKIIEKIVNIYKPINIITLYNAHK